MRRFCALISRTKRSSDEINFLTRKSVALSASSAQTTSSETTKRSSFSTNNTPAVDENLVPVFVDGREVHVQKGVTVLQACEHAGVHVPRFCYHPRLSIAGNCRMCLVEVEKSPKPVASCAMPVMPNMNIKTTTDLVKKAREGVMEFLLINHPLDCPICDQGGECELQDQSMIFGSDRSRFTEGKRAVEDKELGPLVKTVMTRCIHCTRCVRFATEVAGVQELGVTGRGGQAEIGTYVSKLLSSELSGNVIDLCPVGALTSKPFAFTARSWELKPTETIDVLDGLGSSIRVDSKGTEVMRITPRLHEGVNEEWISDKARFSYDGLKRQRLDAPYAKNPKTNKLEKVTWETALEIVGEQLSKADPRNLRAVAGKLADCESIVALKDVMTSLGCVNFEVEGVNADAVNVDSRSNYIMNSNIVGVEDADVVLMVGADVRLEAPVLNARLRRANVAGGVKMATLGHHGDLTYPVENLGTEASIINDLLSGKHAFSETLKNAKNPCVIVGSAVLNRPDCAQLLKSLHQLSDQFGVVTNDWNGFNVLQASGGTTGALDLGFVSSKNKHISENDGLKVVYNLGSETISSYDSEPGKKFVIYQGHHGDVGAAGADVVLPGAAYTEKDATYVNTEGRAQRALACVAPPGLARADWKILRAVSEFAMVPLKYNTIEQCRERLAEVSPTFNAIDEVEPSLWLNGASYAHLAGGTPNVAAKGGAGKKTSGATVFASEPLTTNVENFYMTDAITRASATMARCSKAKATGSAF